MRSLFRLTRILLLLTVGLSVTTAEAKTAKPGGTAFLKSLAVPGWGQYSLGHKSAALAFLGADLALVGGMLTLNSYSHSTRDDYHALAAAYAGISGDHSHNYYVDVGNWMTVDQFNEQRLRNREFDALYTNPADRWMWDTDAHRSQMKDIRIKSDRAKNGILYLVGGLVLNHVASAIHAGRMAVRQREQSGAALEPSWDVNFQPVNAYSGLSIRFSHSF
jgi:hypothetical protein